MVIQSWFIKDGSFSSFKPWKIFIVFITSYTHLCVIQQKQIHFPVGMKPNFDADFSPSATLRLEFQLV